MLMPFIYLFFYKIYHKHKTHFSVESNNARQLVATAAGNIEKLLANRSQALKVSDLSVSITLIVHRVMFLNVLAPF